MKKEYVKRILLSTAGVLCLLCFSTIGLFNKAFAAPASTSASCYEGVTCLLVYGSDMYGWEIVDQGVCESSWTGFGCQCNMFWEDIETPVCGS